MICRVCGSIASMGRRALILLGPPGAGKGTQGRMLSDHFGCPSISTGDALRDAIRKQTDLGREAQKRMEAGGLVPDGLVNEIVKARLEAPDTRRGFILDGYPRTIGQAKALEKLAGSDNIHILAIGIIVDDEILVARLSNRWNCPNCGRIYNDGSNPSREKGRCDDCGFALVQRNDDRPEVVRDRLQVYHRTTRPLIDYYRGRGLYAGVDGTGSVEQIFEAILGIVNGEGANRTASS